MGKASRWFRGLFGFKSSGGAQKSKKKWSSVKLRKEEDHHRQLHGVVEGGGIDCTGNGGDASKRAIAVAAATAAVAEAAVAAAQAAAAVVRLTSSGRNISVAAEAAVGIVVRSREEQAAVTIQSHFRAYLSRRALRALKALVRLQALVRGHLVRKQTAYVLRRLQALVRAQSRARAGRVLASEHAHSSMKTSHFSYPGPATPEKVEHETRARGMEQEITTFERSGSKSSRSVNYDPEKDYICVESRIRERYWEQRQLTRTHPTEDDHNAKILEIDTGANLHLDSKRRSCFYSSHVNPGADQTCHTFSMTKDPTAKQSALISCGEAQSLGPLKHVQDGSAYCTAENSPTFYSTSSVEGNATRGVFTPTNSDCSRSCLHSYYDHPNYMSCTESSKAKVRSASAPKLRPHFDRSSSTKRYTVHKYSDSGSTQRSSPSHVTFANKAYPGSGRLDRLGMHVRGDIPGFSGGHWQKYY